MPDTEPLPLAVTYDEAARLLSCSRDTIRALVARGELHKVEIGTLARIDVAELRALIARRGKSTNGHYATGAAA